MSSSGVVNTILLLLLSHRSGAVLPRPRQPWPSCSDAVTCKPSAIPVVLREHSPCGLHALMQGQHCVGAGAGGCCKREHTCKICKFCSCDVFLSQNHASWGCFYRRSRGPKTDGRSSEMLNVWHWHLLAPFTARWVLTTFQSFHPCCLQATHLVFLVAALHYVLRISFALHSHIC